MTDDKRDPFVRFILVVLLGGAAGIFFVGVVSIWWAKVAVPVEMSITPADVAALSVAAPTTCPPPPKIPVILPPLQVKAVEYMVRKADKVEVIRASLHPKCYCARWRTRGRPHYLSPHCEEYRCTADVKLKLGVKYQPAGPDGVLVECVYYDDPQAELPLSRDANYFKIGTGRSTVDFVGEIPDYRFMFGALAPGTPITIDCHVLPYPRPPGLAVVRMPKYKSLLPTAE